jgi:hypothetical protein
MMPLGSIGPMGGRGRPPDVRRRFRLGAAVAVTFAALVVLWFAGRGSSAPDKVAVQSAQVRRTTTTVHASSTTVYTIALDPSWLPKGSSSYSDSDAKRRHSSLPSVSTTVLPTAESSTTISSHRSRTTTTVRWRSTTTIRSRAVTRTTSTGHVTTTRPVSPTVSPTTATPPTNLKG